MKPQFLNFTFMTVLVLGQSSGLFEVRALEPAAAHGENKTNCESDASSAIESTAQFANNTVKVFWAQFTQPITINIIKKQLEKPLKVCNQEIKPKAVGCGAVLFVALFIGILISTISSQPSDR